MAKNSRKTENSTPSEIEGLSYGGLNEMSGVLLQRAFISSTKYFNREMGEDFQPGYYSTLSLIEKNPGLSQKSLAAGIRRDASTLVPFLDKMEKNGWVIRKRSKTDRRTHELHITAAGRAASKRFHKKVKAIESLSEKHIGAKNYRKLMELLTKYEAVFSDGTMPSLLEPD